jgi:CRISPR/Cas system-associated exonuclease Cas4 (RecB family)
VVPSTGKADWIDDVLPKIKETLDSSDIPPSGPKCEFCPYRETAAKKLLHGAGMKVVKK